LAHQGHLDTARGLARGPAETMDLLGGWLEQHLHEPRSRASRRHLAWLLRSEDRGEPEAWRAANPDEAARAQDLLRKWAKRFAPRIQALVQELEP
jgi:tRNA-dihydrouridine synthase